MHCEHVETRQYFDSVANPTKEELARDPDAKSRKALQAIQLQQHHNKPHTEEDEDLEFLELCELMRHDYAHEG